MTLDEVIAALALSPHPEGGFFRETFRAPAIVDGRRNASTAIYYLLRGGDFAAWHRVKSDEVWHHYAGAPLSLFLLEGGREIRLGSDLARGEQPQRVVPAGAWQAAEARGEWALCGCTVAPGFDFADWEMGVSDELLIQFPSEADLIRRFTRK